MLWRNLCKVLSWSHCFVLQLFWTAYMHLDLGCKFCRLIYCMLHYSLHIDSFCGFSFFSASDTMCVFYSEIQTTCRRRIENKYTVHWNLPAAEWRRGWAREYPFCFCVLYSLAVEDTVLCVIALKVPLNPVSQSIICSV